jgi:hypothetical protein
MGNAAHAGETHECPFQHYPLQRLQTSPRHTRDSTTISEHTELPTAIATRVLQAWP